MPTAFALTARIRLAQVPNADIDRVLRQLNQKLAGRVKIPIDLDINKASLDQMNQLLNKTNDQLKNVAKNAKTAGSFIGKIGLAFKRFLAFQIGATLTFGLFRKIGEGIKEAAEFQAKIGKIAQVADRGVHSLAGLSNAIRDTAVKFGVSAGTIADSLLILKSAGFNTGQLQAFAPIMAKASLAPTLGNLNNVSNAIIILREQFGLQTPKEFENALSRINELSAKFPVEAEGLVTALQKAGGAFKGAGGTAEELLSMFTAVRAATRESSDTLGVFLRNFALRYRKGSNVAMLRETLGIDLADDKGNIISPWQAFLKIITAIHKKGLDLKSIKVGDIFQKLTGLRQAGRMLALLASSDVAIEAMNVAKRRSNSLDEDAIIAQQTMLNQWEKLTQASGRFFQRAFEGGEGLLGLLTRLATWTFETLAPSFDLEFARGIKYRKNLERAQGELFRPGDLIGNEPVKSASFSLYPNKARMAYAAFAAERGLYPHLGLENIAAGMTSRTRTRVEERQAEKGDVDLTRLRTYVNEVIQASKGEMSIDEAVKQYINALEQSTSAEETAAAKKKQLEMELENYNILEKINVSLQYQLWLLDEIMDSWEGQQKELTTRKSRRDPTSNLSVMDFSGTYRAMDKLGSIGQGAIGSAYKAATGAHHWVMQSLLDAAKELERRKEAGGSETSLDISQAIIEQLEKAAKREESKDEQPWEKEGKDIAKFLRDAINKVSQMGPEEALELYKDISRSAKDLIEPFEALDRAVHRMAKILDNYNNALISMMQDIGVTQRRMRELQRNSNDLFSEMFSQQDKEEIARNRSTWNEDETLRTRVMRAELSSELFSQQFTMDVAAEAGFDDVEQVNIEREDLVQRLKKRRKNLEKKVDRAIGGTDEDGWSPEMVKDRLALAGFLEELKDVDSALKLLASSTKEAGLMQKELTALEAHRAALEKDRNDRLSGAAGFFGQDAKGRQKILQQDAAARRVLAQGFGNVNIKDQQAFIELMQGGTLRGKKNLYGTDIDDPLELMRRELDRAGVHGLHKRDVRAIDDQIADVHLRLAERLKERIRANEALIDAEKAALEDQVAWSRTIEKKREEWIADRRQADDLGNGEERPFFPKPPPPPPEPSDDQQSSNNGGRSRVDVVATHSVNVDIHGAEVFDRMKPSIQTLVVNEIDKQMRTMFNQDGTLKNRDMLG